MATRLPPLLDQALLWAQGGARADSAADTLAALQTAVGRGATGLHSGAWITRDGQVVIDRSGVVRRFPRRLVGDHEMSALPDGFVSLRGLGTAMGSMPLRLRLGDSGAIDAVVGIARELGIASSVWLEHRDLEVLAAWRDKAPEVQLVSTTSIGDLPFGPERRAAELAAARIDAVAMPEGEWSGGTVTLFHRFGVLAFADDAHHERQIARVLDMGIDGVSGDRAERLGAVAATFE